MTTRRTDRVILAGVCKPPVVWLTSGARHIYIIRVTMMVLKSADLTSMLFNKGVLYSVY